MVWIWERDTILQRRVSACSAGGFLLFYCFLAGACTKYLLFIFSIHFFSPKVIVLQMTSEIMATSALSWWFGLIDRGDFFFTKSYLNWRPKIR